MRKGLLIALGVVVLIAALGAFLVHRALGGDLARTTLEQQLAARLGQPVRIASATTAFWPKIGVDLHGVTIGEPAAVTLERVEIHTGLKALFSREIANAEIVLADGRIPFPLPFSLPSSPAAAPDSAGSGLTITSIERIAMRNITIATALPPIVLGLEASLHGNRLDIASLTAASAETRLQASGSFANLSELTGQLDVNGELHAAGYAAKDVSATARIAPGRVRLAPVSWRMFGGSYAGTLAADLTSGTPRIDVDGDIAGIDIAQLMATTGSAGAMTGTIGGHVAVVATGADGAALLRSAHGTVDAHVTNGTLPHLDLVRALVLAFGKPNGAPPAGAGSAFTNLGGPLRLASQTVTSDQLSFQSRDLDMLIDGSLHLATGAVSAKGDAMLSRELTAQAGTDLRRYAQQDGRVIVPVTVSGTLSSPTVFVDIAAAAKRAVGNEIQRRMNDLLGGLFKKKGGR
jgi:uncharacterized protein involved in outer membrane biogenesis